MDDWGTRTDRLGLRLTPDLRLKLEAVAYVERLKISGAAQRALAEWCDSYLARSEDAQTALDLLARSQELPQRNRKASPRKP